MTSKINVLKLSMDIVRVYISVDITTNLMQYISIWESFCLLKRKLEHVCYVNQLSFCKIEVQVELLFVYMLCFGSPWQLGIAE